MPTISLIKTPKGVCYLLLLGLLHFLTIQQAFSQTGLADMRKSALEATLPIVVLPSPNAATLTRTINEHVDLYTGKLNVEIPIYNLKSRNVELPISLIASANSHKVNDISSWVGLGWHLNAGGMITRVMKNLPDEWNGTISPTFNFTGVGYLNLNTPAHGNVVLDRFAPVQPPYAPSSAYTISEMKDIIHRGNWNTKNSPPDKGFDLQPDEFYFNFGKYSGKFVFDQNGNVQLITEANMYVTPTISAGKITAFVVTTDDGFKYEFGNPSLNAVEESKLSVSSTSMLLAYRALCQGNSTYSYTEGITMNFPYLHTVYESKPWVLSYVAPAGSSANDYTPIQLMDFQNMNANYTAEYFTYPSTWYLTKITSPTSDYITFNYVSNGTLTYISDRTISTSSPTGESYSSNIYSCSYVPVFLWTGPFFYNPALPKNILPQWDFVHYPSFGDVTISTNTVTLTSKKLKDIVTSQGYKVDFVSTTNRSDFTGDKRLDKISILNNGVLIKEYLLDYENIYNSDAAETYSWEVKEAYYKYDHTSGSHPFIGTWFNMVNKTQSPTVDISMRYRMYLKTITEKGPNQEAIPAYAFDYYNKYDMPYRTSINKQDAYGYAKDNTTPPVLTKLLAGVLKSAKYPTGGRKEFEYQVSGNASAWNGLRIAAIKEFENSSLVNPTVVKNYTYGTFVNTDVAMTSYVLPDVVDDNTYNGSLVIVPVGRKVFYSTSRVNPAMLTRGAVGGYTFVEVSQPNNGTYRIEFTNGSSGTDFQNVHTPLTLVSNMYGGFTKNLNDMGVHYPFPEQTENDWKRGLPVAEYIKGADGKKIHSTHYDYEFTTAARSGSRALAMLATKYRIDFGVDWNWLTYGRYTYYPTWQILKSKTVREYTPDELNYRETVVENTYDRPVNLGKQLLLTRETKVLNSKGEQVVERIRYPHDYTATTDAFGLGIAHLKTKYVFNAPIEKYTYVQNPNGTNKRYVGGLLNKYYSDKPLLLQSFTLQPSSILTSFTESYINGSSFAYDPNYKPAQNFSAYTSYGGIKEQYEESDIRESYIWDHNDTYPVARVTNAAASDIAYSSFEADGKGNWIYNTVNIGQAEKGMTGKKYYSIPLASTNQGFPNSGTLSLTQKYKLTFWNKYGYPVIFNYASGGGSTAIPVSSLTPLITINDWRYYEIDIENSVRVEVAKYSNAGTVYIDELRLHPKNAQMTTYTFDALVGMTSQCDPNNRIVYYEYDGLMRLRLLKDQYGNVTKTFDYNYKQ